MIRTTGARLAILTIPFDGPSIASGKRRWTLALTGAVALHLALAFGAYLRLDRAMPLPAADPIEAILVEMSATPAAPPRPKDARPPGPQAKANRAAAAAATPPRIDNHPPEVRGELPSNPQRAVPPDDDTRAKGAARSEAAAPPSVQAPPAAAFVAPRTSAASVQNAAVTWRGLLLGRLKTYRRYPRRAQSAGQEGVVHVAFTVDRGGTVLGVRIARGSGYPLLDDEALATVRRASPLPPPPDDVPGDPVEVVVPVDFFVR